MSELESLNKINLLTSAFSSIKASKCRHSLVAQGKVTHTEVFSQGLVMYS